MLCKPGPPGPTPAGRSAVATVLGRAWNRPAEEHIGPFRVSDEPPGALDGSLDLLSISTGDQHKVAWATTGPWANAAGAGWARASGSGAGGCSE